MILRPLHLFALLLTIIFITSCGTDTKTTENLGSSAGQPHYSGVYVGGGDNPNNRAQYMGYSLKGSVNIGGTGIGSSPPPEPKIVDYSITCLSCHPQSPDYPNGDPRTNNAILKEYAISGHADVTAIPWTVPETGAGCQRCHTTFGFLNFLGGVKGISLNTEQQNDYQDAMQVLTCSACHTDLSVNNSVHTLTNFTATWETTTRIADPLLPPDPKVEISIPVVTASFSFPAAGASEICIRCHSARRAGINITSEATTTAHYLPAAAMVYSGRAGVASISYTLNPGISQTGPNDGLGYEYTGKDYVNLDSEGNLKDSHMKVGAQNGGPCVTCHMSGSAGHSLKTLSIDGSGKISAINSNACTGCHNNISLVWLNGKKSGLEAAADLLDHALQERGVYWYSGPRAIADITISSPATTTAGFYPSPYDINIAAQKTITNAQYVSKATASDPSAVDEATIRAATMNLQGSAFNLWLCKHKGGDPAAYVHNSSYIKKLIFDTLDYLDNSTLDGTLSASGNTAADAYIDADLATPEVIERP